MRGGVKLRLLDVVVLWVALSSTESEYNALSEIPRDVIHMMQLVVEMKEQGYEISTAPPKVHCKVFEDNVGCLEMTRLPKMCPCTKHLCVKLDSLPMSDVSNAFFDAFKTEEETEAEECVTLKTKMSNAYSIMKI